MAYYIPFNDLSRNYPYLSTHSLSERLDEGDIGKSKDPFFSKTHIIKEIINSICLQM